jgi:serine/threonine-protein kinase
MDANRWRLARELFEAVVDLPRAQWATRLDALCPDDAELREEVLALLVADADATQGTAIAAQAPAVVAELAEHLSEDPTVHAGLALGPFRLVREIGRGGMGAVWLADRADGQFAQQVAIKLVRGGWDSAESAARFRAERQILAGLSHPNIAHLVDGGVSGDGRPWLALEYVDGVDLGRWCDGRKLDLIERQQLFLTVCDAVQHAHARLVVHRDLKPSNILVRADGVVKLLDFGIAKLIDVDDASVSATRIFTPEYAAPEQVRGEIVTTSVDVYALGLLLYELLTGQRPYKVENSTPAAYERAILDQEPTRPSVAATRDGDPRAAANRHLTPARLRRELRGDLDAIVLKALRKQPTDRYASVADLAADVRRHLSRQPVLARRGNFRYRATRFLQRHALAAALATVAVLALVAGLGAALWQAKVARSERDTARQALAFMRTLFTNADPGQQQRGDLTARDLVDEGVRSVRTALAGQDAARADMLLAMASAYLGLGLPEPARPLLDEAGAIAGRLGDTLLEARILDETCNVLHYTNRIDDCLPLVDRIEGMLDARDAEHIDTLVRAIDHRSIAHVPRNRHDVVVADSRRALALVPATPEFDRLRADVTGTMAFSLVRLDRAAEAEAAMRPLVAALRTKPGVEPRWLADVLDNFASTLTTKTDEALALNAEAVRLMESVYGADSPVIAGKVSNYGVALYKANRHAEALPVFERSIALNRAGGAPRVTSLVTGLGNLGALRVQLGDDTGADAALGEAITLAESIKRPLDLGRSLRWRANLALAAGRYADARADAERATAVLTPLNKPDSVTMLRGRALMLAIDYAERGAAVKNDATCAEATAVDARFAQLPEAGTPEAKLATLLASLCGTGAPADAFAAVEAALPREDFRRRQVARIAAAWRD